MDTAEKNRKKLEKAGFSGRTLAEAMDIAGGSGVMTGALAKLVEKRGMSPSAALSDVKAAVREAEQKLGGLGRK